MSTAYVNCDKKGWISEKVYPMSDDPEELIAKIKAIPVSEIAAATPAIIGNYPNTYTYSKNIGERMLLRYRGDVPMCIVRPTIVGAAWRDPFPGWIDSIAAAGAFFLAAGLGLLQLGIGNLNNVGDQVPVDITANVILVAAADQANA